MYILFELFSPLPFNLTIYDSIVFMSCDHEISFIVQKEDICVMFVTTVAIIGQDENIALNRIFSNNLVRNMTFLCHSVVVFVFEI